MTFPTKRRMAGVTIIALSMAMTAQLTAITPAGAAAPGELIISEIMYDPPSDIDGDEFLELHNPSASPVDLAGVCVDGIDYCFGGGTLAAGGYLVLSPDPAQFQATYGGTAFGQFAGGLKNGGETITLTSGATVLDEVDYDDKAPWAVTPDGEGPSLERVSATNDGDDWLNWAASTAGAGHTAGGVNSVAASGLTPRIENIVAPASPVAPGQAITVTANIADDTSASLVWRLDFGPETAVPLTGGAVRSATIPAQAAGHVVRYRVEATNAIGQSSVPRIDDTIAYNGVYVVDTSPSSNLPILEWFIAPAEYTDLMDNQRFTGQFKTSVLVYDNVVYDNVQVRIRGSRSRNAPKPNYKFEMPKGHDLDMGALLEEPVDEFAIQGHWSDHSYGRTVLAWDTYADAGFARVQHFPLRLERNNSFQGLYGYMDIPDKTWREREGFEDGEFYKGQTSGFETNVNIRTRFDKKSPDDNNYSTLSTLLDAVIAPESQAQADFIRENLDLPAVINYAAITAMIEHHDSSSKNFYLYRDTFGTGRWEMLPWDLDHTFGNDCCLVNSTFVTPAEPGDKTNDILVAVLADDELRDMYFRRLRTVIDEFYGPGQYEAKYDAFKALVLSEALLDDNAWPHPGMVNTAGNQLKASFNTRRGVFAADARIPNSQAAGATVQFASVINEAVAGNDAEYFELTAGATAVDISGWTIDELDHTFQPGSVVPANGTVVLVASDTGFRAANDATTIVVGEYDGDLDDITTLTLLRPNGTTSDTTTIGGVGPGPDTVMPDSTITSPTDGATVGSLVDLTATLTDNVGVNVGLAFLTVRNLDTGQWLRADGTSGAWQMLPFTVLADGGTTVDVSYAINGAAGRYAAFVSVFDDAGNKDTSKSRVLFTIDDGGPGPDTIQPDSTFSTPTEGATVGSPMTLTAELTDNQALDADRAYFTIRNLDTRQWVRRDGTLGGFQKLPSDVLQDNGTTAEVSRTLTLPPGRYAAFSSVFDDAGNKDTSKARVKFTIN